MTKIIGLTGGIGSGKTTIANYFKSLGIPVYIADDEAKKIMQYPEIITSLKETFGNEIFENNILSTEKLAKIVFNTPEKLNLLNQIVHPAVKMHFDNWLLSYTNVPFIIKEAAILFESGSYKYCDKIITVISPLEQRILRVMARDKTSRENVLHRVSNQWTDEQRIAKSDYIIRNINVKEAQLQANTILNLLKNT
jgi:dephospho-CoA kinase